MEDAYIDFPTQGQKSAGQNCLCLAALHGSLEAVQVLLQHKSVLMLNFQQKKRNYTALHNVLDGAINGHKFNHFKADESLAILMKQETKDDKSDSSSETEVENFRSKMRPDQRFTSVKRSRGPNRLERITKTVQAMKIQESSAKTKEPYIRYSGKYPTPMAAVPGLKETRSKRQENLSEDEKIRIKILDGILEAGASTKLKGGLGCLTPKDFAKNSPELEDFVEIFEKHERVIINKFPEKRSQIIYTDAPKVGNIAAMFEQRSNQQSSSTSLGVPRPRHMHKTSRSSINAIRDTISETTSVRSSSKSSVRTPLGSVSSQIN